MQAVVSGISAGTEMLAYRGELPADLLVDENIGSLGGTFTYPFRYGYSCVGRIEALAPDVEGLTVGDLVFAFQPHQERFVASAADLVPVPALEPRLATLLPYVETALQVTLDAGAVLGETVVVSGLGVLGLLVAMLVERAGGRVVAIEPQAWRRELAADLGILAVDPEHAADEIDSVGVPIAIECSGNPAALAGSLELLAHEGTALVASWYGSNPVSPPARRPLPPSPADDPEHTGVDHPGRAVGSLVARPPPRTRRRSRRHPAARRARHRHGPVRAGRRGVRARRCP